MPHFSLYSSIVRLDSINYEMLKSCNVAAMEYFVLLMLRCCLCCTVLSANNQQCPLGTILGKQQSCYESSFPDDFYSHSNDKVCQWVIADVRFSVC